MYLSSNVSYGPLHLTEGFSKSTNLLLAVKIDLFPIVLYVHAVIGLEAWIVWNLLFISKVSALLV